MERLPEASLRFLVRTQVSLDEAEQVQGSTLVASIPDLAVQRQRALGKGQGFGVLDLAQVSASQPP
jgi:hypothetical protein